MQAETNESYLIFTIHKRLYAIKNTNVQEIMHSAKIHTLPFVPDYIEGISNSYKYADTVIDISYSFSGAFLEMKIRDHGEGVNPEEISFLTNKFYRGRKNTSGKEGSGLGLYIASELMKKMNGQLICISVPEGFEVILKIPLA